MGQIPPSDDSVKTIWEKDGKSISINERGNVIFNDRGILISHEWNDWIVAGNIISDIFKYYLRERLGR